MSLYSRIKPLGPSGFGYGSTAEQVTAGISLAGKIYLVTGCNSGLGLETLRVLALRGARVIGTARTLKKAQDACQAIARANPDSGQCIPMECELSDPESVRNCVSQIHATGLELDALICNAGIMGLFRIQKSHGLEIQFYTNHIGHFILVTGILDRLTPQGRVVMVSSATHWQAPKGGIRFDNLDGSRGYIPWREYAQSKFANLVFAKELARRFQGSGRTANAVHPGTVATQLNRHNFLADIYYALLNRLVVKTVAQGAATQVYVATHPSLAGVSGSYFADCNIAASRSDADSREIAQKLWEYSEKVIIQN